MWWRTAIRQLWGPLLCASVASPLATGCDPFHTGFEDLEDAKYYRSARAPAKPPLEGPLRVMNYNVKFGGGRIDFFFDCYGDRVLMSENEVRSNLAALARKINDYDPDLLIVQEVDVNSKRAAFVDQMQWLLDHTALDYGVYASQWKADFVPSDGLGAVDSGNGILSKYPLTGAERIAGIDAPTRSVLLDRIGQLVAKGTAVVMTTHHRDEWPPYATHELELESGRMKYAGVLRKGRAG